MITSKQAFELGYYVAHAIHKQGEVNDAIKLLGVDATQVDFRITVQFRRNTVRDGIEISVSLSTIPFGSSGYLALVADTAEAEAFEAECRAFLRQIKRGNVQ